MNDKLKNSKKHKRIGVLVVRFDALVRCFLWWEIGMFNRILQRLGLVTLKNAKKINKTIVMAYSRAITEYSVRDFGVKGNPNQKVDEWANKAFDIIKSDPNGELVCEWEKKT